MSRILHAIVPPADAFYTEQSSLCDRTTLQEEIRRLLSIITRPLARGTNKKLLLLRGEKAQLLLSHHEAKQKKLNNPLLGQLQEEETMGAMGGGHRQRRR